MSKPRTELSQQQLEALIRAEAQNTSNVFFTHHVQKQMRARKITKACVLDALREGRIKRIPEPNLNFGSVECRMERVSAGHRLGVIVAVSDDPGLFVVTAMFIGE